MNTSTQKAFKVLVHCLAVYCIAILVTGCAATMDNKQYFDYQFKDWQQRTNDGWTKATVSSIAHDIRAMSLYRLEGNRDYWQTLDEWVANGFRGDCEDVALAIATTLKRLECPYRVDLIVRRLWLEKGFHVVTRVTFDDGTHRIYETVPLFSIVLCGLSNDVLSYNVLE